MLVPFLLAASALGFVIFSTLYALSRFQKHESARHYKIDILWCLITLLVTAVYWGVMGYSETNLHGKVWQPINFANCADEAKEYVKQLEVDVNNLSSCDTKDIPTTTGEKALLISIGGPCVGYPSCIIGSSHQAVLFRGKYYEAKHTHILPRIPGSEQSCNGSIGGAEFPIKNDLKGLQREIVARPDGPLRFRYTLTNYAGGWDEYYQMNNHEGYFICSRSGIMTAALDGANVEIEVPFTFEKKGRQN
jgi:hypothetical protein